MLIKCPECELQVSDKAMNCPHCGYPMKPDVARKHSRNPNKRRRLPNGFGQITELKKRNLRNPFRAMVTVGYNENGRPICKLLKPQAYFASYNEAYAALVEYNKNPYDLDDAITVEELYERWFPTYEKANSESSIRQTKNAWLYCSSIYNMRAKDVRARHIKGCMEEGMAIVRGEKKQATPTVQLRIKTLFNRMFDYAVEYELTDRNYSRTFSLSEEVIKEVTTVKQEHIAYSDEEMSKLWVHTDNYYVALLLIQCYSGWRPRELLALKRKDVDLENMTFKGGMKTDAGKDRIVPIHSRIMSLVKEKYKSSEAVGCEYLFYRISALERIIPISYPQYYREFQNIIKALELSEDHRLHDGRTHFVTMAKKYGVDEYAIKYLVGHAISDITEKIYTKRGDDWLKSEIEKIK